MTSAPISFAAVAMRLAERGYRPFPGVQETKRPAMRGWNGLNVAPWDFADLGAAISEYEPPDDFCCCLAVQSELVVVDLDITEPSQAEYADRIADAILGKTPLMRIGLAPKHVRVYRNASDIRSRKLHPVEVFAGTGQVVGFGWHAKAGRPAGRRVEQIVREGPISLFITTTGDLHAEQETRMLPFHVCESQEQTRGVIDSLASRVVGDLRASTVGLAIL